MCLILFCPVFSFGQDQQDIQLANEYLLKGEKIKAVELYRELVKKNSNVPVVHNNYINTLIDLSYFSEAQDYLKKNLKKEPEQLQYKLDVGLVMMSAGDVQKADRHFKELINENKVNHGRIKQMSDYFTTRSLFDYSIISLLESRNIMGNPGMYCLELATLYRIKGERDKMTKEYLNYATQNVGNSQYIKNVLQVLLTKPEELESLEKLLYEKVQQEPEAEVYTDLLIWVNLQQKNFYGAFVQARAYDRRYKTQGARSLEIADMALNNKDYENATIIYRFVKDAFSNGENSLDAQLGYIRSREARMRETYPIVKDSVKNLLQAYYNFINKNPQQFIALEATRNAAMIRAEFLQEPDSAIQELTKLISNPYASGQLKSKAKLNLADIYVMVEQPWESSLLYSQVEKTQKESQLGYEAKLKNAKLSYYRGDFALAQEHLDILKQATTREIANDAMDMSMRIKENLALDSTGTALQEFAKVELLLKQNKIGDALKSLQKIEQGTNAEGVAFQNYAIKDDCYWLEAEIMLQQNKPQAALSLLEKIVGEYPADILADDAFFKIGELYERHLNDPAKAMQQYQDLLAQFPGSVYAAEARKRFRQLRGDFKNLPQEPKM